MSQHVTKCLRSDVGRGMAAGVMVASVHEIGHAVAALHCGAADVHCWIDGERGRCNYVMATPFSKLERIVIALAGPVAERIVAGTPDGPYWTWPDTIRIQHELSRFMFSTDDWLYQSAYHEARKLVDANWLTIHRHARTLARMKTLTL